MANPASNASRGIEQGTPNGTPPAARPQVDVVAVTGSDDFLIDLGDTLAGRATVRPADTAAAAVELLWSSRRGQVLVIDAREIGDLRAELAPALAQAPHAVCLVFTLEGDEEQVAAQLAGLAVQAVLPVPFDRRKTALAFDGAFADAARQRPAPTRNTTQSTAFGEPLLEIAEDAGGGLGKIGLALAALGVVALGGGTYWFLHRSPSTAASLPAAAVAPLPAVAPGARDSDEDLLVPQKLVETTLVQGKVDDLLEQARGAMRERHYTEPAGKNALLYYRSAHAADPSNAEANDGLQRVAAVLVSRFEEGLKSGRVDEAAGALANLQAAIPGDARLSDLQRRLTDREMTKLLADGNFETANRLLQKQSSLVPADQLAKYRAEIAHRQQDLAVARLAGQIDTAIRDGRLEGSDDSARGLLAQLQAAAPGSPAAVRALHDLAAAYLRRARDAKSPADQDHWLQLARASGISQGEIDASRREIALARQKAAQAENERTLALVRERLRDGRLTEPAQDSAVFYVGQLQTADPNGPSTGTAKTELAAKLLERARGSINIGKTPLADADIQLAKRYGGDAKEIGALTALESSRAEAAHNVPAAAPAAPASSTAAAPGSIQPKRLRYVPPEFPAKALAQALSGSVTVAFIVDGNGDPRDLRVMEASPPGVFDHAAMVAVKRWHYEPTVVDGKPQEVPVQVVVRFPKPN